MRQANHHHDGRLVKNGNVLFLCATELPGEISGKIRGGRPGTEVNGKIWSDYLLEVTKARAFGNATLRVRLNAPSDSPEQKLLVIGPHA